MRIFLIFGWSLVALEGLLMLAALVSRNMGDDAAGRGVAAMFGLVGLGLIAAAAALLYFGGRAHSWIGVALGTGLLVLPLIFLLRTAATSGLQELQYRISAAKTGRFPDTRQRELAAAIQASDVERMRTILALRPNLTGRDPIGYDLLSFAVKRVQTGEGGVEPVRLLLDAGMDPNQSRTPSGLVLLSDLAETSNANGKEVVRLLLEHHADPNVLHSGTNRPPLDVAEDPEIIKMLVAHGANVNWRGKRSTPLIHSILTSHWDNAIYLIGIGADLQLQAGDGTTPASAIDRFRKEDGTLPEGAQRVKDAMR
jgi:ankyrin repeat protein